MVKTSKLIIETLKVKPLYSSELVDELMKRGETENDIRYAAWNLLDMGKITVDNEMRLILTDKK